MKQKDDITAVILCGGRGLRLYPLTKNLNKHLLPIYTKPMIYHPISLAIELGLTKIIFVCNPSDKPMFEEQLSFLNTCNIHIDFVTQIEPLGFSEGIYRAIEKVRTKNILALLGDNIFLGENFALQLEKKIQQESICHIFTYPTKNPERFGIVMRGQNGEIKSIHEKSDSIISNEAITGLYLFNTKNYKENFETISLSEQGEYQIVDILTKFLLDKTLICSGLSSTNIKWFDAGTINDFNKVTESVRKMEAESGKMVACIEEIAFKQRLLSKFSFNQMISNYPCSDYKTYLSTLIRSE